MMEEIIFSKFCVCAQKFVSKVVGIRIYTLENVSPSFFSSNNNIISNNNINNNNIIIIKQKVGVQVGSQLFALASFFTPTFCVEVQL